LVGVDWLNRMRIQTREEVRVKEVQAEEEKEGSLKEVDQDLCLFIKESMMEEIRSQRGNQSILGIYLTV
jgi:hypothetical protein